jgi:hypothetical protein
MAGLSSCKCRSGLYRLEGHTAYHRLLSGTELEGLMEGLRCQREPQEEEWVPVTCLRKGKVRRTALQCQLSHNHPCSPCACKLTSPDFHHDAGLHLCPEPDQALCPKPRTRTSSHSHATCIEQSQGQLPPLPPKPAKTTCHQAAQARTKTSQEMASTSDRHHLKEQTPRREGAKQGAV